MSLTPKEFSKKQLEELLRKLNIRAYHINKAKEEVLGLWEELEVESKWAASVGYLMWAEIETDSITFYLTQSKPALTNKNIRKW